MKKNGFDCFKMKVGQNIEEDKKRLKFIRSHVGEDAKLMLDANQIWGVEEAIAHMEELTEFNPIWIEEPTARDDVQGHLKIARALKKYDIEVATGEQVPSPVIFKQLLQSVINGNKDARKYVIYVIIATIPVVCAGLLFQDIIESTFSISIVKWMLLITGLVVGSTYFFQNKPKKVQFIAQIIKSLVKQHSNRGNAFVSIF